MLSNIYVEHITYKTYYQIYIYKTYYQNSKIVWYLCINGHTDQENRIGSPNVDPKTCRN